MKKRGQKLPAAVVLGGPPCVTFTATQKLPETMEEMWVAGGLVGALLQHRITWRGFHAG